MLLTILFHMRELVVNFLIFWFLILFLSMLSKKNLFCKRFFLKMLVMMFLLFERILLMVHWLKIYLLLLFLVLCHMLLLLTLSLHKQVSVSNSYVVLVLNYFAKVYDDKFFNRMFDLELSKLKADLERIYGWQPLELVNVNTTSRNVFNNLQNCPITINLVDPRAILVWWQMWLQRH